MRIIMNGYPPLHRAASVSLALALACLMNISILPGRSQAQPFASPSAEFRASAVSPHSILADSLNFFYSSINASQFPKIVSEVKVWGNGFTPIEGLTEANFTVFEDSVLQSPIQVQEFKNDSGGVSVVMLMDVSGSMQEEIGDAKNAAITFVNLLQPLDQAALFAFYENVELKQGFTHNKQMLIDSINALTLGDGTSIYDAVMQALDLHATIAGKRAIVILSDGRDNSSAATLQETLQRADTSNIPIFTIGLGLKKKKGTQQLKDLARVSGGFFYDSPTSSELEDIYRQIAFILSSDYYVVSYNSSRCSEDGTVRKVRIEARYQGLSAQGSRQYRAPGSSATLVASTDVRPVPGKTFRLILAIPPQGNELFGMMQLQLRVKFDPTFLKIPKPLDQNIRPGTLPGSPGDYTFHFNLNETGGVLNLDFQRKTAAGPISGKGRLAEIVFMTAANTPDNTEFPFEIQLVKSANAAGCPLGLQTGHLTVRSDGMIVWPGDTNHNGTVELTDVLPLGIYWEMQGPARSGGGDQLSWAPHLAKRFPVVEATHTDADGNGRVTERDLIPIGLNWGKTTAGTVSKPALARVTHRAEGKLELLLQASQKAGVYSLNLNFSPAQTTKLAGLAFRLRVDPGLYRILSVRPGEGWPVQPLVFSKIDPKNGQLAMSLMLPAGSATVQHRGKMVNLEIQSRRQPHLSDFHFEAVGLISQSGEITEIAPDELVPVSPEAGPEDFVVLPAFPNPFNPSTQIQFFLLQKADVQIRIFNALGQEVRRFIANGYSPGWHTWNWQGRDQKHRELPGGVYLLQILVTQKDGHVFRNEQGVLLLK
ncbi:MAG: VWA domain-containing protein [Calditrichaeota bacterium]|nr:MAG: VWA domain-containing protein [Calditrichota bacterium]